MLLIVTNKTDLTSDYLLLRLKERGISFVRLNTEDYLSKFHVNITLINDVYDSTIYYIDGTSVCISEISGVYFRQPIIPKLGSFVVDGDLDFAEREALETLRSLWRSIDETIWVNPPKYLLASKNKVEQLKIASQIGFNIPPTLVSSDTKMIKQFYDSFNGDIICKAVKHGFYKNNSEVRIAPTQKLGHEFIQEIDLYAQIPMIFQKRIDKKYDLRVTVVDDLVFPAALHSQKHYITKVDWRLWDAHPEVDLKHSCYTLPNEISKFCINVTRYFKLRFSAIDMVHSTDGNYYFLEMNPNGQWAWIEEKLGYPIRDSIINCLEKHKHEP